MVGPRVGKKILCTGGAGYIGVHTAIHLERAGYECYVLDNLSNSTMEAVHRLRKLAGRDIKFSKMDLRDYDDLLKLFQTEKFDGVIHYAAAKAVGESVSQPLHYYENNLCGLLNLLKAMTTTGVKDFVFSSSATVYQPTDDKMTEESAIGASNPYGHTKTMSEQILKDMCKATTDLKVSILRYFNPVGAHPSGDIGESPDYPMNLLPFIQQVAVGRREKLGVFGNDWPTPDGTGVRDYIHVEDLAEGHIAALAALSKATTGCCLIHNLGTGRGHSVLELVKAFETANGVKIPYEFTPRRGGDIARALADPTKANKDLQWKAQRSIEEACKSAHKWQTQNPKGYV